MSDAYDAPPAPSSPTTKYASKTRKPTKPVKEEEDEDEDIAMAEIDDDGITGELVNFSAAKAIIAPKVEPIVDLKEEAKKVAPDVDVDAWKQISENLISEQQPETASYGKLHSSDALEDDGSLKFFWIDYTEVNGALCLFGKVIGSIWSDLSLIIANKTVGACQKLRQVCQLLRQSGRPFAEPLFPSTGVSDSQWRSYG